MFYLLSLTIFFLKIIIEDINIIIVYKLNTIMFLDDIREKSSLRVALIIFKQLSNGSISHIVANNLPTNSLEKYIPLVKHTN